MGVISDLPSLLISVVGLVVYWAYDLVKCLVFTILPAPKKDISDDIILVTGAASGIGRLMAYKLAGLKPRAIVVWDLSTAENEKTKKEIEKMGVKCIAFTINLAKREAIYEVADETSKGIRALLGDETAYVTMLINNAGIVSGKKLLNSADHMMSLTMDVNATAHFWTLKSFLPAMMQHNRGHIVTIASGAGLTGAAGLVDYCASKHAAVGLTESILMEIYQQNRNVNVTLVCPYFIDTGMFKGVKSKYQWLMPIITPADMTERIVKGILTNEYQILYPRVFGLMIFLKGFFPINTYLKLISLFDAQNAMSEFEQTRKH